MSCSGAVPFCPFNIAWGYDLGEDHAHVTTNCSPFIDDQPVHLFHTHEVESVTDPKTGGVLYPVQQQTRPLDGR